MPESTDLTILTDDDKFGSRSYVHVDGTRYLAGFTRELRPVGAESNAAFERRMDLMVERLAANPLVATVHADVRRHDGLVVECFVDVVLVVPTPAPIVADARPAGKRAEPRGVRGGQRPIGLRPNLQLT